VWIDLAHERYCSLLRLIRQTIYRLKDSLCYSGLFW
jgi:hypothetical protein